MIIDRCLRNSFGEIVVVSLINYLSLATATWDGTYYRECEYPELQALFAFNGDVASKKKENRLSELNHIDFSLSLPNVDDGTPLYEEGAKVETNVDSKWRPWMRSAYMEHKAVVPSGRVHKVPSKLIEKGIRKEASDKKLYEESHDTVETKHFQKGFQNPRSESFDVRPKDEGFKEEITQLNRNERFDESNLHFRNQNYGISDVHKPREEISQSTNGLLTPLPAAYRQYTADGTELKATCTDPLSWPIPEYTMPPKHSTQNSEEIVEKSDLVARYPLKLLPQEKKSMNSEKDQPRPNEVKLDGKRRNEAVISSTTNSYQLVPDPYSNVHVKTENISIHSSSGFDFAQSSNTRRNQVAPGKSKVVLKRQYKEYIPEPHDSESAVNGDNRLNQDAPNWNTDLENPSSLVHSTNGVTRKRSSRQNVMAGRKRDSKERPPTYRLSYPLDIRSSYQYDNYLPRRRKLHRRKTGREFKAKRKYVPVENMRTNYYSEEEKKLTRSQYANSASDFQSKEARLKPINDYNENPKEEIIFVLNNEGDYA